MYNFFVEETNIKGDKIIITEDYNHIVNVLRKKENDEILVSIKNIGETYLVKIESIEKSKVICSIIKKEKSNELDIDITLFQGLPKLDKMELIIQKAVELGVKEIYPVDMKFSLGKVKDFSKIERWQKISEAASKQAKRNLIPKINTNIPFEKILELLNKYDLVIVGFENEKNITIKQILKENKPKSIAIIIGAEGGISEKEIEKLKEKEVELASLGKTILRTETAGIAMISMIVYEYEL